MFKKWGGTFHGFFKSILDFEWFLEGLYQFLLTFFNKTHFTRLILVCNILYLADLEDSKDSEQSITTARNYIKFSVWVSFFEIYNECFYDLLIPMSNDKKRKTLRLAQDIKGCSFVKGE